MSARLLPPFKREARVLQPSVSVSYTHLDVYKRQTVTIAVPEVLPSEREADNDTKS